MVGATGPVFIIIIGGKMNTFDRLGFPIACSLLLVPASLYAGSKPYPRAVMACDYGEGGSSLEEIAPGQFSYHSSEGFNGAHSGGEASVTLIPSKEECSMTINASEETKEIKRSFSWPLNGDFDAGFIVGKSGNAKCKISKRYRPSLGKCIRPSEMNPGNQCYGEPGRDVSTKTSHGFMYVFAGGISIDTGDKSYGSPRPKAFTIYQKKGNWCYDLKTIFPHLCQTIQSPQSIVNVDGHTIGVVELKNGLALFRPAKLPPKKSGYELDDQAETIQISVDDQQTQVTVGRPTEVPRKVTILGEAALPTRFGSSNLKLENGQEIVSDCNGLVTSRTVDRDDAKKAADFE